MELRNALPDLNSSSSRNPHMKIDAGPKRKHCHNEDARNQTDTEHQKTTCSEVRTQTRKHEKEHEHGQKGKHTWETCELHTTTQHRTMEVTERHRNRGTEK